MAKKCQALTRTFYLLTEYPFPFENLYSSKYPKKKWVTGSKKVAQLFSTY